MKEPQFDGSYKVNARDGFRGAYHIDDYDVFISTAYGIGDIIRFIEKLLAYAMVRNDEIKISFKA